MAGSPNTHICYHPRRTLKREQLNLLDARLGKGVGATRERARLAKMAGRAA